MSVYGEVVLSTKLKNRIKKFFGCEYEYHLKNIIVNGTKKGCSGFIKNPSNNVSIYITTEPCLKLGYMYRYAEIGDYTGYFNQWSSTLEHFICDINHALSDREEYDRYYIERGKYHDSQK